MRKTRAFDCLIRKSSSVGVCFSSGATISSLDVVWVIVDFTPFTNKINVDICSSIPEPMDANAVQP